MGDSFFDRLSKKRGRVVNVGSSELGEFLAEDEVDATAAGLHSDGQLLNGRDEALERRQRWDVRATCMLR